MSNYPILIAGCGRVGKTLFAKNIIESNQNNFFVFELDALLHKYVNDNKIINKHQLTEFIYKYLNRPRFIDAEKKVFLKPKDILNISTEDIIDSFDDLKYPMSSINVIFNLFSNVTRITKKKSWLILDIHSEFYFIKYKYIHKNLKLLMLTRNPIEIICAELYWRSFPKKIHNYKINFWYYLILLLLSRKVGENLRKKFPNDIYFFDNNNLTENNLIIEKLMNISPIYFKRPLYFDFDFKSNSFYTYNNIWEKIFTIKEIKLITYITKQKHNKYYDHLVLLSFVDKFKVYLVHLFTNIGKFYPVFFHNLITYLFFPNRFIQFFKKLIKYILQKKIYSIAMILRKINKVK